MALLIPNFGARLGGKSITPCPFYSREKLLELIYRRLGGPQNRSVGMGFLPLQIQPIALSLHRLCYRGPIIVLKHNISN